MKKNTMPTPQPAPTSGEVEYKHTIPIKKLPTIFKSCKEAYDNGFRGNGFRHLESGLHYCRDKVGKRCGEGGWTLALSSLGSKSTFQYDSPYWEDERSLPLKAGQNPLSTESKSPAFWKINMTALCLVMKWQGGRITDLKFEQSNLRGRTLLDVMKGGRLETNLGREAFVSLRPTGISDFDPYCNAEGFNVIARNANFGKIRLGILWDNDNTDCNDPNSFLGIGYYRQPKLHWGDMPEIYAGAACNWGDNCHPRKVLSGRAYLYVL